MSAIWGCLSYTNTIPETLPALMEAPYHAKCRIDRYGTRQNEYLYFGCGIQYITKEAQNEVLPVFDEQNGIFFAADCILNNRDELISLLRADSAEPDGTLMYLAYKKWGIDCLKHFRGLFGMAVYDKSAETLYLATDQTASRCLYYYKSADAVCFSTLLEPIRKANPALSLNELYLKDYLTAPGLIPNIVPTETPYTGVFKINPGCYMTITQDNITEHTYWSPFAQKTSQHFNAKTYGKEFRALYTACVNDTLRTDGEVGISMSSGLDSASVGALAATQLRKKNKTLYSYTYVPYETPEPDKTPKNFVHDETADVMKIVNMHPNIKPHFLNNEGKNCTTFLSQGLDIMEIPFKATINLPNLYEVYCQARKDNCRVVLTGQAGNASVSYGTMDNILFDSYQTGHFLRFLLYFNNYCLKVKHSRKRELRFFLRRFRHAKKVCRTPGISALCPDNPFLASDILDSYPYRERYAKGELPFLESVPTSRDFYPMFLYNKAILTYLGELDTKLGLASGIVLRDPTRDSRIIAFCAALPYHLFAYNGTPRWLIRGNFSDILPADLLNNFTRYGVQNSDWMLRIRRDWDLLSPEFHAFLHSCKCDNPQNDACNRMIHLDKAEAYLSTVTEQDFNPADAHFRHFIFCILFLRFIKEK